MLELTDESYQSEISSGLVVVDFWADWCGPCRMYMPILERLADKYEGKIKFCKVDTSEQIKTTTLNKISSLPTLLVLKDGEQQAKLVGFQSEKKVSEVLDGLL